MAVTVNVSPLGPKPQFVDWITGAIANGYQIFFYVAGSVNTKQATYTDSTGTIANTNPLILNSAGQPNNVQIWFTQGQKYKMLIATPTDSDPPTNGFLLGDQLIGQGDTSFVAVSSQWLAGPVPSFISATQFSFTGDQTSNFQVGRRVQTTNSGGTIYGRITVSAFAAGITTVTIVTDSGVLDSGLSAVNYGILSSINPSTPTINNLPIGLVTPSSGAFSTLSASGAVTWSSTVAGGTYINPANSTQALTDQATITWDASVGQIATVTVSASRIMAAPTNLKAGGQYVLRVTQDATGGRTLTWNAVFQDLSGGAMSQPSPGANSTTQFVFESDGTNLFVNTIETTGTWTPSVGGTATYTNQSGVFVKIGRFVFVRASLTINAIGSGSTTQISGLPFTSAADANEYALAVAEFGNSATAIVALFAAVNPNSTTVILRSLTAAAATVGNSAIFGAGTLVNLAGCYEAV